MRFVAITLALLTAAACVWLSRSTVIVTSGGVYDRILLPIGGGAVEWRADQARIASNPRVRGVHGPIVTRIPDGSYTAQWFCLDRMRSATFREPQITVDCAGDTTRVAVRTISPVTPGVLPAADRIAVVSDIEGDVQYFRRWAKSLGVIDSLDQWRFGTGQVVVVGDAVDRGRDVYALLWLLYSLDSQAAAAGGALHLILGNHELYDLLGITKDIEAEHLYAMTQRMSYSDGLASTTVLGGWLRSRNVMQRIGRSLFVHGGISPEALRNGQSIDAINTAHRTILARSSVDESTRRALMSSASPTQYRGFVRTMPDTPLADTAHVARALAAFDVDHIIIGHTEVDSITNLFGGRVIDVNASLASRQVLTLEAGRPVSREIPVQRTAYADTASVSRRFSVTNADDWRAFVGVFTVAF